LCDTIFCHSLLEHLSSVAVATKRLRVRRIDPWMQGRRCVPFAAPTSMAAGRLARHSLAVQSRSRTTAHSVCLRASPRIPTSPRWKQPSPEDTLCGTIVWKQPSLEDTLCGTIVWKQPSLEDTLCGTIVWKQPSLEDTLCGTLSEPSWIGQRLSMNRRLSMNIAPRCAAPRLLVESAPWPAAAASVPP